MSNSSKGFSLIEILVGIGILVGSMYFVTSIMNMFEKSVHISKAKLKMVNITEDISSVLMDETSCTNTASSTIIDNDESLNHFSKIYNKQGLQQYVVNEKFSGYQMTIDSMWLSITEPSVSVSAGGTGTAYLKIKYIMLDGAIKNNTYIKKIKLGVETDGANKVTSCQLYSSRTQSLKGEWNGGPILSINRNTIGTSFGSFSDFENYPDAQFIRARGVCQAIDNGYTSIELKVITEVTGSSTESFTLVICAQNGMGAGFIQEIQGDQMIPITNPIHSVTASINQGSNVPIPGSSIELRLLK